MRSMGILAVSLFATASLAQSEMESASEVRWKVVRALTPEGLAQREAIVVQGTAPVPFHAPKPEHFRLERLGPESVWMVMTFGWPEGGPTEFNNPEGDKVREVTLHLRRSDDGKQRLQTMKTVLDRRDPPAIDLYAEGALHKAARYRLSWTFRLAGSDIVQTKRCEFRIGEASANRQPPGNVTGDTSRRPCLVEILFRDDEGVLFLGQTVLTESEDHDRTIAAVAFTSDGRPVPPPDPGYLTKRPMLVHSVAKSVKPKPPPAARAHLFGASIGRAYAAPCKVVVFISDMGTSSPLPKRPNEPTFVAFSSGLHHAVFRVELLTTNVTILRQDPDYWRKRTRAITAELLQRRTWIREDTRRLATVTRVLGASFDDSAGPAAAPESTELDDHIDRFEAAEDGNSRWLALQRIAELNTPDAYAFLRQVAEDRSRPMSVRLNSINLWPHLVPSERGWIRKSLIHLMDNTQPKVVSEVACRLAAETPTEESLDALAKHWPVDRPPEWAGMAALRLIRHIGTPAVREAFRERIESPRMQYRFLHGEPLVDLGEWQQIPPEYRTRLLGFVTRRPVDRRRLVHAAAMSAARAGNTHAIDFLCDRIVNTSEMQSFLHGYHEMQLFCTLLKNDADLKLPEEVAKQACKAAGAPVTEPVWANQGRLFVFFPRGNPAADGEYGITVVDGKSFEVVETFGRDGRLDRLLTPKPE